MQLPAIIVTDSEGQHCWSGKYSAWGNVSRQNVRNVGQSTVSQFAQPLRNPGQYNDDETGLRYNTFRYYDPEIGRFTTQDPIGLRGGLNLYSYAPNPLSWVDPLGLKCGEVDQPEWTPHNYKHFPPKNKSWKDIINSTKTGPAKYKPGVNVKSAEYDVFNTGIPVTNGKPWKIKDMGEVIGAIEGKPSQWMRVELSAGTIHWPRYL